MELDFTKLSGIPKKPPEMPLESSESKGNGFVCLDAKNAPQGPLNASEGVLEPSRRAEPEKRDDERARQILRRYQESIRATETLRVEITRGVKNGEAAQTLFLKAAKAVSLATGDAPFYDRIKAFWEARKEPGER